MKIYSEQVMMAIRILSHVRNHLKGKKFPNIKLVGTETFCNGREQGFCLIAYPKAKNEDPLRVMFSEHRISDGIVVYDERGLGQNGNMPIGDRGSRTFHERVFEGNGPKGNEEAAAKAIYGIIESYDTELSEPWKHR